MTAMTTAQIINKILSYLKLSPRHLATFAIASVIIFIIPQEIAKAILPETFHNYYRPVAVLVFVLSISGLFVELIVIISKMIMIQLRIQKGKTRLNSLTEEEKNILRKYVTGQSRTNHFSNTNGAASELESIGVLVFYGTEYHIMQGIPYGIADWALKYLVSNPHLLHQK